MTPTENRSRPRWGIRLVMIVVALFLATLPFVQSSQARPVSKGTINLGVKDFAESAIITDMYQLLLQKQGFTVQQHKLATTPALQGALLKGNIDLYGEYTGTGLLVLNPNMSKVITNGARAYALVKAGYKNRWNLIWLDQTPMNDTNGVAVTQATAKKYNLATLSDLAKVSKQLTFADYPECRTRMDCLKGMEAHYGITFKSVTNIGSAPLRYKALTSGKYDVIQVFTTDAPIGVNHLVVLADDKHAVFPADHVAPIVRNQTLTQNPTVATTLNKLAPLITTQVMIDLNGKVILQSQDAMKVAQDFLKSKGLL